MKTINSLDDALDFYKQLCDVSEHYNDQITKVWNEGQDPVVRPVEMPTICVDEQPRRPFASLQVGLHMIKQKHRQIKEQNEFLNALLTSDEDCLTELEFLAQHNYVFPPREPDIEVTENSLLDAMQIHESNNSHVFVADVEGNEEAINFLNAQYEQEPSFFSVKGFKDMFIFRKDANGYVIHVGRVEGNSQLTKSLYVKQGSGQNVRVFPRRHTLLRNQGNK